MITKSRGATKPKTAAELDARPRRALPKTNGAARQLTADRRPDLRNTSLPSGIRANDPDALPPQSPAGAPGPSETPSSAIHELPLDKIEISKDNPRTHFDPEALQQLADSLLAHGMIQPVVVRPPGALHKNYELVAGERRYRAAKLAGWKTVPVKVRILSDAAAAEIRLVENLEREDLTAIEEAVAMQKMLDTLGYTQERLAEKLKRSQPHIANRLRLLKLPKHWQARIISQEIPPTHARALIKYADCKPILDEIEQEFFRKGAWRTIGSFEEFQSDVDSIADECTAPMEGKHYAGRLGRDVPIFAPSDADRKKLAIVELDGKLRATNVQLWNELRKQQIEKLLEDKSAKKGKAKAGADATPTRSPAEVKAAKAKADQQLNRWIDEWRTNWLRLLLSRRVLADALLAQRVVIMALCHGQQMWRGAECDRAAALLSTEALHRIDPHSASLIKHVAAAKDPAMVLTGLAVNWLWREGGVDKKGGGPADTLPARSIEALAAAESIDLAEEWKQDLAGPLTESFYNRHPREAIEDLANHFSVQRTGATKRELVGLVMNARDLRKFLPKSIKPVAAAAAGKKPKKKGGAR